MGDELAPQLRKAYPNMMVLVLTNMEHEYYIKTMLGYAHTGLCAEKQR